MIFDRNPDHSFYIEESFPLDWMYPHLVPHGPILKLHRQPLSELSELMLRNDHKYWTDLAGQFIGHWLREDTPIHDICRYVDQVHRLGHLDSFGANPKFVACKNAQRAYSKLRSNIGGLYAWRYQQTKDLALQSDLAKAADVAFRQAYGLCPYSPEALFRYVTLLASLNRFDDALLLSRTTLSLNPDNVGFQDLTFQLERLQKNRGERSVSTL